MLVFWFCVVSNSKYGVDTKGEFLEVSALQRTPELLHSARNDYCKGRFSFVV